MFSPLSGPTTIAGSREMLSALLSGAPRHRRCAEVGLRHIAADPVAANNDHTAAGPSPSVDCGR